METDDVKVTAMNMYKYKEGLRFCKRWPCSIYISLALLFLTPNPFSNRNYFLLDKRFGNRIQ